MHLAILGVRLCHAITIVGARAQKEDTMHREHCRSTSDAYSSILLGLFVINGMDGMLEGHNIARTTPRPTSKCLIYHDSCVLPATWIMRTLACECCQQVKLWWLGPSLMILSSILWTNRCIFEWITMFRSWDKSKNPCLWEINTILNSVVKVWSSMRPSCGSCLRLPHWELCRSPMGMGSCYNVQCILSEKKHFQSINQSINQSTF